jgi:hypothetical protein
VGACHHITPFNWGGALLLPQTSEGKYAYGGLTINAPL